jgi:hypothetical protein
VYEGSADAGARWVVEVTLRDDDDFNDLTLTIEMVTSESGHTTTVVTDLHVL